MTNVLNQIHRWFKKAVPEPTDVNQSVQMGCHLEEVAEMLQALNTAFQDPRIHSAQRAIELLADAFKKQDMSWDELSRHINRVELLDSMADQIVTAVGVFHMMDFDIRGLTEVANSNDSKFENGQPVFNENRKIIKGKNYYPPNLAPFSFSLSSK